MAEENEIVFDMTLNIVQLKYILVTFKRKRPGNILNIKQVYNTHVLNNKVLRDDKTEMPQLLKLMDDQNYVSRYRVCKDGEIVRDIFWTHHDFIKLFNIFPTVLIISSTYKTNKYKLTLLKIVGVTFTEKIYSVVLTFLESKKEDNANWALEVCQKI
ncbi:uncharacterized protein LOC131657599 [Vicia villosa]|uniref:uncharacterized protein LOC131657599 n=1 Tax=Vicia villosa TaxID=3911 RepID=UPI00273B5A8E|nr:uncharacterized protein LOC131657599 [Vicia villosa]